MVAVFREGVFSSRKWSHMIIDAAAFVPAGGDDEGDKNYLGSKGKEEINKASYSEDDMELDDESDLEVEFDWQDDISDIGAGTDWGPPVRMHRAALDLLRRAMVLSHRQHKSNTRLLSWEIRAKPGDLDSLISKHGTLAGTLETALESGTASYNKILELREQMDDLGEELKCFAKAADVTKEFLLGVITRVSDLGWRGNKKALNKIRQVEELLGEATANCPPSPPLTLRTSVTSAAACIDAPLGMVSIGGNATPLMANLLFTMIRDLQVKVDILMERSKSTGVIFDRRAFSSETEFIIWFLSKNPSGKALAGFVDIISIWAYGTADHVDQTQWSTKLERSRKVGLKGSVDVSYAHSMSTRYPTLFVGSAKDQILAQLTLTQSFTFGRGLHLSFHVGGCWGGEGQSDMSGE
jgi:hypothetical protein